MVSCMCALVIRRKSLGEGARKSINQEGGRESTAPLGLSHVHSDAAPPTLCLSPEHRNCLCPEVTSHHSRRSPKGESEESQPHPDSHPSTSPLIHLVMIYLRLESRAGFCTDWRATMHGFASLSDS